MSAPRKTCSPLALAGAHGLSTEVEGADRPTPHPSNMRAPVPPDKRRTVVMVWRGGLLPMASHHPSLTVRELALLARANCTTPV